MSEQSGSQEGTQGSDELAGGTAVVPESGRVPDIRLPVAEWAPVKFLQLYEEAPFADWGSSWTCP